MALAALRHTLHQSTPQSPAITILVTAATGAHAASVDALALGAAMLGSAGGAAAGGAAPTDALVRQRSVALLAAARAAFAQG